MNDNIKNEFLAFEKAVIVALIICIAGLIMWAFIAGGISAWNWDLGYMSMPMSEWYGIFRLMVYFFCLVVVGLFLQTWMEERP